MASTHDDIAKYFEEGKHKLLTTLQQVEEQLNILAEKENQWNLIQKKIKENIEKSTRSQRVKLDVGGKIFATSKSTLLRWPNTYFQGLLGSGNWEPDDNGCYFIDRNPKYFDIILDYLRTGELDLHGLDSHSIIKLNQDLDYLQLPLMTVSDLELSAVTFQKISSKAITYGNTLQLDGDDYWASAWSPHCGSKILYWEIKIDKYKGNGHIRVGIANFAWDPEQYVGDSKNSLGISPENRVSGFKEVINTKDPWCKFTIIGMLFDRNHKLIRFYNNKTFICQVTGILDPYNWFPAFSVHCKEDSLTIIDNPTFPSDYVSFITL